MIKFVNLLRTPDARYAIGAAMSWPVYGSLYIAMLRILDRHYAAASGISWILSYGVVYTFQKYGSFGAMSWEAMLREVGHYAVAVVGLSAAVNFELVTVLAGYDSTLNKTAAVAAAAVAAALVAWFVSRAFCALEAPADLCLLKTCVSREFLRPLPYRRGQYHNSFHRHFHPRLPASSPRLPGTRAH